MQLLQNFPGKVCNFPGKYLGLPLHVRRLRRIGVQPLLEKIGVRIPGSKERFLTTAGRETLVKTVFPELKWLIRKIDRIRRSFLWRGETPDKVYGGHSLVNWPTACLPKILAYSLFTKDQGRTRNLRPRTICSSTSSPLALVSMAPQGKSMGQNGNTMR